MSGPPARDRKLTLSMGTPAHDRLLTQDTHPSTSNGKGLHNYDGEQIPRTSLNHGNRSQITVYLSTNSHHDPEGSLRCRLSAGFPGSTEPANTRCHQHGNGKNDHSTFSLTRPDCCLPDCCGPFGLASYAGSCSKRLSRRGRGEHLSSSSTRLHLADLNSNFRRQPSSL